jgi:predicted transcriptional regulator
MAYKTKDPEERLAPDATVRLPWEVLDQMKALASAHERSLRAEVRVALAEYVKRQEAGR